MRTDDCADDCFGCKAASISFSATATPTRRPVAAGNLAFEKKAVRDMAAYARLKKEGIQPKRVQGCADAEQFSNSDFEIHSFNRLSSPKVGAKYDEAQKFLRGPDGLKPITPRQPVADQ